MATLSEPIAIPDPPTGRPARAEPVGSLLRGPELIDAVHALLDGGQCASRPLLLATRLPQLVALRDAADRAIPELVRRQLDAGLDVVTDGELRRPNFLSPFYDAIDGLERSTESTQPDRWADSTEPVIASAIRKVASPLVEEVSFLRGLGEFAFKVTLPAPSYFYMTPFVTIAPDAGLDRQQLIDAAVAVEQQMIAEAIAAGAQWIQLDFPLYPALADAEYVASLDAGLGADDLLDRALAADRAVVEHVPAGVTKGMHLCRGNLPGGFWSGTIEPTVERLFNELPYDRFVMEWDDADHLADFSTLRHVPAGVTVALGLVDSRTSAIEDDDEIVERLDAASRYVDLDRLALTSQCGFSSYAHQSLTESEAVQWAKLELIGRVADRVWGR